MTLGEKLIAAAILLAFALLIGGITRWFDRRQMFTHTDLDVLWALSYGSLSLYEIPKAVYHLIPDEQGDKLMEHEVEDSLDRLEKHRLVEPVLEGCYQITKAGRDYINRTAKKGRKDDTGNSTGA